VSFLQKLQVNQADNELKELTSCAWVNVIILGYLDLTEFPIEWFECELPKLTQYWWKRQSVFTVTEGVER
jgi:hypothetical protein